ncbi:MAG TPA: hypothetical protein VM681_05840, partial [Candidatus Thermoplasmatota archaeon]|nr:hypothetical protein [Candidatus Thermoplasmatota archaeon]
MSFIVAVGIFMAAFSVLVLFLSNIASESGSVTLADLESRSAAGLDVLLGGPGAPPNWGSSGDAANALSRMGLLEAGSNVRLDPGKLLRMANAPYAASPTDGHVSYEEAKRAMGLSGYDFHVRIRPAGSFDPLAELRNVSVAYIGDWREGQECLHVSSGAECRESLNESRSLTELAQTWGLRFRNATFFPNFTLAPTLAADKFRDSDFDETVMRTKQTYNLTLRLNGWETGGFDTTNLNALAHWRVEPRVSGRL